jgi:hypothetical protein
MELYLHSPATPSILLQFKQRFFHWTDRVHLTFESQTRPISSVPYRVVFRDSLRSL